MVKIVNMEMPNPMNAFASLPNVHIENAQREGRLIVRVGDQTVTVSVITRASGFPRDVREAVWQARSTLGLDELILVVAPVLTATSREWLQSENVGYLDGNGNLFLAADSIYLLRESSTKAHHASRSSSSETNIYKGRTTQVLHTLLHSPQRAWHVTELAAEARVAAGTAIKVCEPLENMLWMEREGRGPQSLRRLIDPGALLDAWSQQHQMDSYTVHRYYRWTSDLTELATMLGAAIEAQGAPWALTQLLGAMQRAPFVTNTEHIAFLVPGSLDIKELALTTNLKPADEGYNVVFLVPNTEGPLLYRHQEANMSLASDIQLYLDLINMPGRGREQAEHLRMERIGF